jgi:hypothetical protein
MFSKKTPRIEYTAYLPQPAAGKPIDPAVSVSTLPLESFTLKALDDAGIETIGDAMALLEKAASEATVELPKGIGKRRLKEIEAAIFVPAANGVTPDSVATLIFGAFENVARRCGPNAIFHSGEKFDHEGRAAIRIRWSAGADWRSLVRKVKLADKHFHACPLRRMGTDPITEILE